MPPLPQIIANLNFNFLQVVQQHALGLIRYIIWVLFITYCSFQRWKYFENRLGSEKVIAISWWSTFLGHSVFILTYLFSCRLRCRWELFAMWLKLLVIFTARTYARAVLGVVILSVRLSHAWIVTNLNGALQIFWYHTKGHSLCYSDTNSG